MGGWGGHLAYLGELSERQRRPVVFAEIGYDLAARREPWLAATRHTEVSEALRRRLIATALEWIEREPFIHGMPGTPTRTSAGPATRRGS